MNQSDGAIRNARALGIPRMLLLGLQHMFAMFGATILVPMLVNTYFVQSVGEPLTRGLTISITLFCAGAMSAMSNTAVVNRFFFIFFNFWRLSGRS